MKHPVKTPNLRSDPGQYYTDLAAEFFGRIPWNLRKTCALQRIEPLSETGWGRVKLITLFRFFRTHLKSVAVE
jgi:hypothetical protein